MSIIINQKTQLLRLIGHENVWNLPSLFCSAPLHPAQTCHVPAYESLHNGLCYNQRQICRIFYKSILFNCNIHDIMMRKCKIKTEKTGIELTVKTVTMQKTNSRILTYCI